MHSIEDIINSKREDFPRDIFEVWLMSEIDGQNNFILVDDGDDLIAVEIAREIKRACIEALLELQTPTANRQSL